MALCVFDAVGQADRDMAFDVARLVGDDDGIAWDYTYPAPSSDIHAFVCYRGGHHARGGVYHQ